MKANKVMALLMVSALSMSLLAGCGGNNNASSGSGSSKDRCQPEFRFG